MKPQTRKELLGVLLIAFGLFIFLSIISYNPAEIPAGLGVGYSENYMGPAGLYLAQFFVRGTIGFFSLCVPILIMLSGWYQFQSERLKNLKKWTKYSLLYCLYAAILVGLFSQNNPEFSSVYAGKFGTYLSAKMLYFLRLGGSIFIFIVVLLVTVIAGTGMSIQKVIKVVNNYFSVISRRLKHRHTHWQKKREEKRNIRTANKRRRAEAQEATTRARETVKSPATPLSSPEPVPADESELEPELSERPEFEKITPEPASPQPDELPPLGGIYQFPTSNLLAPVPEQDYDLTWEELDHQSRILEDSLQDFGIEGKVIKINPGPVITRFEVEPAAGIKVSKFTSLADDLARVMRAKRIRIVAPIPGKASIGVEIPNPRPQIVYFSEVVNAPQFVESDSPLTLVLGKTIDGKVYITDLRAMPHLLIAGATGSGKSVCINTIIASILFKAHPQKVQITMIDPKRLELAPYRYLRHHHLLYRPDLNEEVITSPNNAISILKSMVLEMERRYELLAHASVRHLEDFNIKFQSGKVNLPEGLELNEPLPYLVLVIDELADLMLTAAKEVEEPIARLTQMSRAVGIHLIVATQRPSVDVITGVIKANFPCRIGFYVASKTDSRTILDMNGAEKLLGRGDMLFLPPGNPEPVRLHGAFISTEEVENIVAYIKKQPRFVKTELPLDQEEEVGIPGFDSNYQRDKLFNEAAKTVVLTGQGSVSILQRRLKVGYARAARLIDELEMAGIVGPFDGSKAREVLIGEQELQEMGIF